METASRPFASTKYLRQFSALLALCGLNHWRNVLIQFMEHYAGLEMIVDDDREGPHAAVIHLLRDLTAHHLRPSDQEFARFLSELAFLHYRARRARPLMSFEMAELWQPLKQSLSTWRLGYKIGAWRSMNPPVPLDVIAQILLSQVQSGSEHPVLH